MNENPIYYSYRTLNDVQLKFLCFLSFTGRWTDEYSMQLYRRHESLSKPQQDKLIQSLQGLLVTNYYHRYMGEYKVTEAHVATLLVFMVSKNPALLSHFEKNYKSLQTKQAQTILSKLKGCLYGTPVKGPVKVSDDFDESEFLAPLVDDDRFLPMMTEIQDVGGLVNVILVAQYLNDKLDPENRIAKIAALNYNHLPSGKVKDIKAVLALYDYYFWGRYDEEAASWDVLHSYLLAGAKALYDGDYAKAFGKMVLAVRESNKIQGSQIKGHFYQLHNNYLLVLAYYLHKPDNGKKLAALLKKNSFTEDYTYSPVVWLARYFSSGNLLSGVGLESYLKGSKYTIRYKAEQYIALIVARFLHADVQWPEALPTVPNMYLLRHELSPWINIGDAEKKKMRDAFGGEPLLSRIRFKQKWELLLDELTPDSEQPQREEKRQARVFYRILDYGSVEVREQTILKSGAWSAGKRMAMSRFMEGADIMDDVDRKIASAASMWDYDLSLEQVLPYLVGSDRVFTGSYAPFTPVTVVEEKPFLVIERTKSGFLLKSNVDRNRLEDSCVYRKESDTFYAVIKMTNRQKTYYSKLLSIGTFPLEAEQQLREFLPKVSDIVEVHSDLVEGGSTLQHRDGSPLLCLQVLPQDGMPNHYVIWCMARPLTEGTTLMEAGRGMNPCVAEQEGVRYQVTRDIKGERANLELLRTFLADSSTAEIDADEIFADRTPALLDTTGLLILIDFVRQQPDRFFMEWPEGGKLNLKTAQPSEWNISLRSKNGWFEVEGEIPIDDETVLTVGQLLQLVAESPRDGFVRLGDGDYLALSDRLRKQLSRLESLTVSNRGKLQVSEFHASLLGSALSGEIEIKHDKRIDQLQKKIQKSMAQDPEVPPMLKAELRDYQTDGYQWMTRMTGWGAGVCLADDMGLGKTVQTIAFMLHTADQGPALVAAPASVVLNWQRELRRFAPSLNVGVLNAAADRKGIVEQASAGDVVLTTYGLFVTEDELLCAKEWNTVCLDEAHVIKNRQTKTSSAVMRLQATHRIILTGTPVQNHLGELWNLFQFANPGLLGSHEQFRQKYIIPIEQQENKERSQQLKRIVGPFMLRRTKQEVIEELPDKTEVNLPVELSDDELAVYEVIRRRAKEMLEEDSSASGVSVNTLAEITRLRQAACSAELVEKGWKGECSKLNALGDLLQEIVDGGNAVLVFSQFTSFLSLVRQRLDKQNRSYLYLDGAVPVRQRDQLVQQFQRGQCPIFLISLKAGGLGLNLTGANYVIHLDPWWNPAIEQQATDRAYRIGQRQNVTVYHLISQHTIEEKILRLHQTKRNLADAMLEGTNESHKLTSAELLAMIDGDA